MRLIDFLILLLQTQAKTLQRLAALFGEEVLFQVLEETGNHFDLIQSQLTLDPEWFELVQSSALETTPRPVYGELEGAVNNLQLPAVLEFYLWSYPYYRKVIEGSIDLKSRIRGSSHPAATFLIEDALAYAKTWIKQLPIAPEFAAQAERTALAPWIRFRSEFLKMSGKRPMTPI